MWVKQLSDQFMMTVHEGPFQLKDFIPTGIFQRLNIMSVVGWLEEKLENYLDYSNSFSLKMIENGQGFYGVRVKYSYFIFYYYEPCNWKVPKLDLHELVTKTLTWTHSNQYINFAIMTLAYTHSVVINFYIISTNPW